MNTFFTADTHFQHEKILELMGRPFASIQDHDRQIVHWINHTVGEFDRLYILGDFAMKDPALSRSQIRCKDVIFIWGNHDSNKLRSVYPEITDVLDRRFGEDGHIFMSHYPHAFWPGSHKGYLHLYGHCHGMREPTLDACFPMRRSMDCGVDVARKIVGEYRPFALSEILDLINTKTGHDPVEWYKAGNHHPEPFAPPEKK